MQTKYVINLLQIKFSFCIKFKVFLKIPCLIEDIVATFQLIILQENAND